MTVDEAYASDPAYGSQRHQREWIDRQQRALATRPCALDHAHRPDGASCLPRRAS